MNKVYLMDCMEGMRNTPDKWYDLCVCDPPYGIKGKFRTYHSPEQSQKNSLSKFKNVEWDNFAPTLEYWNELKRVSKNQIIWGGNYFIENLFNTRCWIVWDKMTYIPTMSQIELAWTSFDKNSQLVKINSSDKNRLHPTQKPIALYDWIFSKYATKGMKILDTHAGSMSSVISALKNDMQITAYEIDSDYFNAGKKRIETYLQQGNIFQQPQIEFIS